MNQIQIDHVTMQPGFEFYIVTRSYSSRPFLCALGSHSIVHCSKLAYTCRYSNHAATTHFHKHAWFVLCYVNSVLQRNLPFHKLSDNQHTLDCVHSPQCTQPVHRQKYNQDRGTQTHNHTCYHTNCWI